MTVSVIQLRKWERRGVWLWLSKSPVLSTVSGHQEPPVFLAWFSLLILPENHSARDTVWLGVTLQDESGASQPLEGRCHSTPPASAAALCLAQGSVPRTLSITGKWLTIRSLNIHNTSQYSNDYPKNKVPLATLSCNRINKKMKTKTRAAPVVPPNCSSRRERKECKSSLVLKQ